ncbi:MAG: hypothetical protein J3Q66DRAFT_420773 [Benniella sp.]|nr:MAG: hypothetical protein J3Q66DRAFT_420773 [Benniella sp.]
MLVGDAGTGIGSRIKGHARRGGKKLRKEHIKHCPVVITDEYRSSRTCTYCYHELQTARYRRTKDGKDQIVRVHGALECTNSDCPSFQIGYTIRPRDAQAAVAIAIAGVSTLLSPAHEPIAPLARTSTTIQQ